MPTYQYACTECGHRFDAVQSFSDQALTTCPECGGTLRKVYGSVGVVFKGSGFYRTDSRSGSKASTAGSSKPSEGGSSGGAGDSSSSTSSSSGSSGSSGSTAPAAASSSSSTAKAAAS